MQWRWPSSHTTGHLSSLHSSYLQLAPPVWAPTTALLRGALSPIKWLFLNNLGGACLGVKTDVHSFHLGRKSIFCIILVLIIQRAKSKVNWFPEAEHTFGVSTNTATVKEQTFQFSSSAVDVNKIAHEANYSQLLSVLRTIMFFVNDHLC